MSVVATVAQTVASTPVPSPAVVAIAIAPHVNAIQDNLNALAGRVSQADLLAAAAAFVVFAQSLVNKFPFLKNAEDKARELTNYLLSFLFPFVTLAVASFASGNNTLHLAPYVYLAGQFVYAVVSNFKSAPAPVPVSEVQV